VNGTQAYIKPESTIGATIASAMNGVTLQDLRIDAQNASDDGTGASSFGMIVNGSNNVVLTQVEIHAGKGASGPAGSDGVAGMDGTASGVDQLGKKAICVTPPNSRDGGMSILPVCTSQGGAGGKGVVATTFDATSAGAPTATANSVLVAPTARAMAPVKWAIIWCQCRSWVIRRFRSPRVIPVRARC
jgi:hypothetical protein